MTIGFEDNKELLFQRLNCTIPSGSVVIGGYNSSGKTSLCKSLMGLIPLLGNILYDNIDINKIDISWLESKYHTCLKKWNSLIYL